MKYEGKPSKRDKRRKTRALEHAEAMSGQRRVAVSGTGAHKSNKDYNRFSKHKKSWDDEE